VFLDISFIFVFVPFKFHIESVCTKCKYVNLVKSEYS
jgi:phage FluMu protein Com